MNDAERNQEAREINDDVMQDNGRGLSGTCPSDCSASRLLGEVISGLSVNGALGKIAVVYETGEVSREGTRAMMDQIDEWRRRFREMQNAHLHGRGEAVRGLTAYRAR